MTKDGSPENASKIQNEEHDHTATAKRVTFVDIEGNLTDANDILFDANDSAPDYLGTHTSVGVSTADTNWLIYNFTYSGSNVTQIQKKVGAWTARSTLF